MASAVSCFLVHVYVSKYVHAHVSICAKCPCTVSRIVIQMLPCCIAHTPTHTHTRPRARLKRHTCTPLHIQMHIHTCTCACAGTHAQRYKHTCIRSIMHIHTCTCTSACTHTDCTKISRQNGLQLRKHTVITWFAGWAGLSGCGPAAKCTVQHRLPRTVQYVLQCIIQESFMCITGWAGLCWCGRAAKCIGQHGLPRTVQHILQCIIREL